MIIQNAYNRAGVTHVPITLYKVTYTYNELLETDRQTSAL